MGEQELLSIVETLKEFRTLLWGQEIIVHTDHKNIIYGNLTNDRIARWQLLIKEYNPTFVHVKGTENVVADALSRLDKTNKQSALEATDKPIQPNSLAKAISCLIRDKSIPIPDPRNRYEMAQCFATDKERKQESFPVNPALIAEYQQKQKRKLMRDPKYKYDKLTQGKVEGHHLLHYNGKIVVPPALQERVINWYHYYLQHPGTTCLEHTIRQILWWPQL